MIWISGPPRSGTTMLNLMISGDKYLPECTIITEFLRLYSLCKNDPDPRYKTFMGGDGVLEKTFAEILKFAMRGVAKDAVLKDPNLCLYLPEWQEFFPQDRMVIIIRDPRDAVGSMLAVLRRTNADATVRQAIDVVAPHFFQIEKTFGVTDNVLTFDMRTLSIKTQESWRHCRNLSDMTCLFRSVINENLTRRIPFTRNCWAVP